LEYTPVRKISNKKYCELHPTPFFPGGKNEMELRSQYPVDNFSFQ
jgi:hypothetical protein